LPRSLEGANVNSSCPTHPTASIPPAASMLNKVGLIQSTMFPDTPRAIVQSEARSKRTRYAKSLSTACGNSFDELFARNLAAARILVPPVCKTRAISHSSPSCSRELAVAFEAKPSAQVAKVLPESLRRLLRWSPVLGTCRSCNGNKPFRCGDHSNLLVEQVTWFDAQEFCAKPSEILYPQDGGWTPSAQAGERRRISRGRLLNSSYRCASRLRRPSALFHCHDHESPPYFAFSCVDTDGYLLYETMRG